MKSILLLAVGISTLSATAQTRRPVELAKPLSKSGAQLSLSWLPAQAQTQKEVLEQLARKARVSSSIFRVPVSAPARDESLSARELDEWLEQRERGTSKVGKSGWIGAAGQLLLARELGESKQASWRLWGAGIARRTAIQVAARDGDQALGAHILEGFALPFINDLPDKVLGESQDEGRALEPNKQTLLQDATNFYRAGGNPQKLLSAVVALIVVAQQAGDIEGADWARIKLAQDLGNRGRFYEAVAQLKAVTSPNLLGAREWIPELEGEAKAANQTAPDAETPAT